MKNVLIACTMAFVWALWPILAEKYGKGQYVYTLISFGTFVVVGIVQTFTNKAAAQPITPMLLLIPLALGLLNGIGIVLYSVLLGGVPKPSTWVSVVTALICVFAVIIGAFLTKQITLKETLGLLLIISGVATLIQR